MLGRLIGNPQSVPHRPGLGYVSSWQRATASDSTRAICVILSQPLPLCVVQRNDPSQDVIGTLGNSAKEIGVGVGNDGPSKFGALVPIQRLYTQNVSLHEFGHRANEQPKRALGLFMPSVSTRTEHHSLERWSCTDADPRASPVSDRPM